MDDVVNGASKAVAILARFKLILDCPSVQGGLGGTRKRVVMACAVFFNYFSFWRDGVLFRNAEWAELGADDCIDVIDWDG